MPNGQGEAERNATSDAWETAWDSFFNWRNRVLGRYNIFRYRTLPHQTSEVIKLLGHPIDINNKMLSMLQKIEGSWRVMDKYLWEEPSHILKAYEEIGHYDDPAVVDLEIERYRSGNEFRLDPTTGYATLQPVKIKWNDGNMEELYIFGFAKIAEVVNQWRALEKTLDNRAGSPAVGMDRTNRAFATDLRSGVIELLLDIQKTEKAFYDRLLKIKGKHITLASLRNSFLKLREPYISYIRFKHTYKVIKPFVAIQVGTEKVVIEGKEVEIPSVKPMYFNPNENPYTEELEDVNRKIAGINEAEINRRIRELGEIKESKKKKIEACTEEAVNNKINEGIRDLILKILRYSGAEEQLKAKLGRDELAALLREILDKFGSLLKRHIHILAIDPKHIRSVKDEIIDELTSELRDLHIKDEDIDRFLIFLRKATESLEKLNPADYKKRKPIVIDACLDAIRKIGANPEAITKFRDLIVKICDYSTVDFDQSVKRFLDEILDLKEQLNIDDEEILKIHSTTERNIKTFVKTFQDYFKRVEARKRELGFDDVIREITNIEEQISDLQNQIVTLNSLRSRKDELEKDKRDFTPRHPQFQKWPWEVDYGLDENGYPLEIDDNGVVLLDKWRYEIFQNPWQRRLIGKRGEFEYPLGSGIKYQGKGNKGGQLEYQKMRHIMRNGIRVVDERFTTNQAYLDLLEMSVYIYTEVDAVRDDTRDGRYHKHSKTTTDYIIHAEGHKIDPNKFKVVLDPLKQPINLRYNQFNLNSAGGYILARPDFFNNPNEIPAEELAVTREYRIKEYKDDLPLGPRLELGEEKERKPTNISPAFDRRALNRAHHLLHWGRMYYYEDVDGINKWSENPYPHITTRGVAKYLMYWFATKTSNLDEAAAAADAAEGYDIGIRRPIVGGKYIRNPFREIIRITPEE